MPRASLAQLNQAAALIGPFRFARVGTHLVVDKLGHHARQASAAVRADGLWFRAAVSCDLSGGTDVQLLVQLVRWHRNQPRRGLPAWTAALGADHPVVGYLAAEGYFESAYTACLRCGAPDATDWTVREGLGVGPLCWHGLCPPRLP